MIIDSIILENFGAYAGRQEAILTPQPGKPIVIFGGMNGGGKTTLLDALQLAFYGSKARISNRGRLSYKDYLRASMHRSSDPSEGSSITVRFHRVIEGEVRNFELYRYWREGIKGIEETVRVKRDGLIDDIYTDHWDETIENYLPSSIAHLFFFDGEQIKDLAEGGHAAEILGKAIHSLLGLDLVDRLDTDLKVYERRKKAETNDPEILNKIKQATGELDLLDKEQETLALAEGTLVNEAGRLGKTVRELEVQFHKEGGDLFLQRKGLAEQLNALKTHKHDTESQLRELIAGPLPLLIVEDLLAEVEQLARQEGEIRRARLVLDALEERDNAVLENLKHLKIGKGPIQALERALKSDRHVRSDIAHKELILDANEDLAPKIAHLRGEILPDAEQKAKLFQNELEKLEEKIARTEEELERVPSADSIAIIQEQLTQAQTAHNEKLKELNALQLRKEALKKQRETAEQRLEKLGVQGADAQIAEDDRSRILKHSGKVRQTLQKYRAKVVQRHTANMEALMLESFSSLLRKGGLVRGLTINPTTFETTLTGQDGKTLPFDRLSAGERQLLATSLLWGLARASGRSIPTVIDTPLGRLDSSHRRHLIERYFPCASHQVILLSTDEEIIGSYLDALQPYISNSYLLDHNEDLGQTQIIEGYFKKYEAAS